MKKANKKNKHSETMLWKVQYSKFGTGQWRDEFMEAGTVTLYENELGALNRMKRLGELGFDVRVVRVKVTEI